MLNKPTKYEIEMAKSTLKDWDCEDWPGLDKDIADALADYRKEWIKHVKSLDPLDAPSDIESDWENAEDTKYFLTHKMTVTGVIRIT